MNILKALTPLSVAEREELRQLRQKCEYQQRWINNHVDLRSPAKVESDRIESLKNALKVEQRRVARLRREDPETWRKYFSKEAQP